MIYLDSSVALSRLFAEARQPLLGLWKQEVTSSRLLEYEIWNRIHARGFGASHGPEVRELLKRLVLVDLTEDVLVSVLQPFPIAVRTLDAIHLATMMFLRRNGRTVELASYDRRLCDAATALAIPLAPLP